MQTSPGKSTVKVNLMKKLRNNDELFIVEDFKESAREILCLGKEAEKVEVRSGVPHLVANSALHITLLAHPLKRHAIRRTAN